MRAELASDYESGDENLPSHEEFSDSDSDKSTVHTFGSITEESTESSTEESESEEGQVEQEEEKKAGVGDDIDIRWVRRCCASVIAGF